MATPVDITADLDHVERLNPQPEIIPAVPDFAEMTIGLNPNTLHRYAQQAPPPAQADPPRQSTVTVEEVVDEPPRPVTVTTETTTAVVTESTATTVEVVTEPAVVVPTTESATAKPAIDETVEDNIVHKPFSMDDLAEMKREFARIAEENQATADREKKELEDRRVAMAKAAEERRAKWTNDEPKLSPAGASGNFNRYFIDADEFYDDDYTDSVMAAKAGNAKRNVVSWDEDKLDDIQSKVENIEDLATAVANEVESISERLGDTRRRMKDLNDVFRQLDTYIRSDAFVDKIADRLVQKLCGLKAASTGTTSTLVGGVAATLPGTQ